MNLTKIHYDICDSTNIRAKEYLKENSPELLLITANEQSAGRGRQGKSFYSPKNTGVYMTFAFRADLAFEDAVYVTTAAAAKVCHALESLTGNTLSIKWVNDIYYNNKKICGILTESVVNKQSGVIEYLIVGVGVNLTTTHFPKELSGIAGSLCFENKQAVIDAITTALTELADNPQDCLFMDYYKSRSLVLGKKIKCIRNGIETEATAIDIDSTGGLVIRLENGEIQILRSGEISIRLF